LNYLSADTLLTIYQNYEISYQILAGIIKALVEYGARYISINNFSNEENALNSINLLKVISKTKNFQLTKKFLKKTDKEGKILCLIYFF
jgi:hypothetical protein